MLADATDTLNPNLHKHNMILLNMFSHKLLHLSKKCPNIKRYLQIILNRMLKCRPKAEGHKTSRHQIWLR